MDLYNRYFSLRPVPILPAGLYTPDEIKDKSKVKLIFLSCGSREKPEGVKNAADELKASGINAVHYISEKIQAMSFIPGGAACMNWRQSCSATDNNIPH